MEHPRLTDIAQLSSWLRYNKRSCAEVVGDCLAAIESNTVPSGLFTHTDLDNALAIAAKMDHDGVVRQPMKPLAGLPFAVQEVIAVDGQPSSAATNLDLAELMPKQGPLVRKLVELGAIPIGKTVSAEFSLSVHNLARALPDNPHYPDEPHIIGGSGSGIAVAEALCSFALGAEAVGISRISAAMAGVTGFRPGPEFWSRDGIFPLSRDLDAIGLITAKATDMAFLLEALGLGSAPSLNAANLRLGVAQKPFYEGLDATVRQAMNGLFERLTRSGSTLTPIVIPDYEALRSFTQIANGTGLVRYIGRDRTERLLAEMDPVTQARIRPGMDADIGDIQRLFDNRRQLANRINSNLGHIDALIMPTLLCTAPPVSAFPDAASVFDWQAMATRNIHFASIFGMTAITIPIPAPEPVGLQLVAPAGNEIKLVGVARAIQQALDVAK